MKRKENSRQREAGSGDCSQESQPTNFHSFDKCSSTHNAESTMAVGTAHGEGHGDNESVCQGRKTSQGGA